MTAYTLDWPASRGMTGYTLDSRSSRGMTAIETLNGGHCAGMSCSAA